MDADQPFIQRDTSKSQLPDGNQSSTPFASHPATPRMLRSTSGNLKTKSEMSSSGLNERSLDAQLLPPLSIPSPASTPVGATNAPGVRGNLKPLPKPREVASPALSKMSQGQNSLQQMNRSPMTPSQYSNHQSQQRQQTPQQQRQTLSHQYDPNQQPQTMYVSQQSHQPQPSPSPSQPPLQQQHHLQQQRQSHHLQQPPPQQQQFHRKSIGDWNFVKTIGAGSMGKVKLAQHNTTHEICAVKIIPRAAKLYQRAHAHDPPPQTSQEAAQRHKEFEKELARDKRTIREGALGRLLFHPFICRLYEMVPMTNHYYMLFEYIEGGQMLDYIVAHGSLKEKHARKFARGIASALDYCHRNNVVHRDLKIENIMINEKGDVKIIDFGLSNLYSPKNLLKTYCGSLYFAAPELLSAKPYIGPEVDIWSFGVVLYVLVCGKVPFDDQSVSVLHEKIKKGNVEYPNFLSKECINLLSRMLVVDPNKRASLYEICSHPWMNKGYDHKVSNYLPRREPLRLPLDPEIIKQIAAFDLGSAQTVTEELTTLLTSVEYQMSTENWYNVTRQGKEYASAPNSNILPDPTGGFHPLISIYYLVVEMRKRKKAKEEAIKAQLAQQEQKQQQLQQQQQSQQQKLLQQQQQQAYTSLPTPKEDYTPQPTKTGDSQSRIQQYSHETATQVPIVGLYNPARETPNTPQPRIIETFTGSPSKTLDPKREQSPSVAPPVAKTPVISVPEQAHTSAIPSTFDNPPLGSTRNDQLEIPEQQPRSPRSTTPIDTLDPTKGGGSVGGAGFNNLFRKLSSKKSKGTGSPKIVSPPGHELDSAKGLPHSSQSTLDPLVRRGVSMKVTAKEKESGARLSPTKPDRRERKQDTAMHAHSASTSTPNRPHGFIPVEYLPPLPNYDPNTNTVTQNTSTKQQTLAVPSRKLHPTARAKSVGGQIRKDAYGRGRSNTTTQNNANTELAHSTSPHNTELSFDESSAGALFDDVKLDDMEVQEVPQLTEDEIIKQYNEAKPGSMPSIEHCKTLFLKGFFSVQTTSTKPLPVIRYNIINVLSRLGVRFQEVKGGFICVHTPSVQQQEQHQPPPPQQHEDDAEDQILDAYANDDENEEENELYGDAFRLKSSTLKSSSFDDHKVEAISEGARTPNRQLSISAQTGGQLSPSTSQNKPQRSLTVGGGSGTSGHRRKISIGNTFLNTYRKKNNSQVQMPPNTPATARTIRGMYGDHEGDDGDGNNGTSSNPTEVDFANDTLELDNSAESLSGYMGGSDMLVSSKIEHRANHQRTTSTASNSSQQYQQHQQRRSGGGGSKSPLKFEIHIVKVPLVGLYGVQFKKLLGNTWNYKTLASQILNEMNL